MPITKGFRTLVDEATAQITTYTVAQVQARLAAGDTRLQLVDIRDPRELEREGTVPGCVHAPSACWRLGDGVAPSSDLCRRNQRVRAVLALAGAVRWPPRPCKTWA